MLHFQLNNMPCSKTEKDILYFPLVLIPAVQTFTKLQCEGWGGGLRRKPWPISSKAKARLTWCLESSPLLSGKEFYTGDENWSEKLREPFLRCTAAQIQYVCTKSSQAKWDYQRIQTFQNVVNLLKKTWSHTWSKQWWMLFALCLAYTGRLWKDRFKPQTPNAFIYKDNVFFKSEF